jgi:hypothetical protein
LEGRALRMRAPPSGLCSFIEGARVDVRGCKGFAGGGLFICAARVLHAVVCAACSCLRASSVRVFMGAGGG